MNSESKEKQLLAAVHNFFLLKDDQQSIEQLWSMLAPQVAGKTELPALPAFGDAEPDTGGYCRIVHRLRSEDIDICLLMLGGLSAVQILYRLPESEPLSRRWESALKSIETDRDRLAENISIFGETTVLVSPEGSETKSTGMAISLSGAGEALKSDLKPDLAGGDHPRLLKLLVAANNSWDYYAVIANEPEAVATINLTQMDSLIKRLSKFSIYFKEQRNTIISERIKVDREVGELLHNYVVISGNDSRRSAGPLETRVDSLSQMFGLLATDSLLVRQAAERLHRDISSLEKVLGGLLKPGGSDEIGRHYLGVFRSEMRSAQDETANLSFSRQNANSAIDVVRTQVELLRAGEEAAIQQQTKELLSRSLIVQQERLSLQVAAGFIEFVLIFYYLLKSWEGVAGIEVFDHISSLQRMLVVGAMSAAAAIGTHFLAQSLSRRTLKNKGLWLSAGALVLSFIFMVILTLSN